LKSIAAFSKFFKIRSFQTDFKGNLKSSGLMKAVEKASPLFLVLVFCSYITIFNQFGDFCSTSLNNLETLKDGGF